jgi:peptidoglycan/LPS O-acetylase OafA/YrhL
LDCSRLTLPAVDTSRKLAVLAARSGYRPELDGLRALAVLAVFVSHIGYNAGPSYLGVNVFFVLSGFLITTLLLEEEHETGSVDYRAFYTRRILRLYPALVAVCVLTAAITPLIPGPVTADPILRIGSALTYVTDFTNTTHVIPFGGMLGQTWTLAVEEQFYLIWPVVLMALAGRGDLRRSLIILTGVLAVVPVISCLLLGTQKTQYTPLGASFQLIAGAALAVSPFRVPRRAWLLVIVAYFFIWAVTPSPEYAALQFGPMQFFTATVVILLMWALTYQPALLGSRALVWTGRRSYGVYLYQTPILFLLERKLSSRSEIAVVGFVLTMLAAAASYRWLEKPFLALKTRYARVTLS